LSYSDRYGVFALLVQLIECGKILKTFAPQALLIAGKTTGPILNESV